jgi:hypothetical protein
VTDIVADVRPEWRTAAASNLSCKTVRKIPAAAEENNNSFGFSTITAGVLPSFHLSVSEKDR